MMKVTTITELEEMGYVPATEEDAKEIIKMCEREIDIEINNFNQVWTEGGIYIADVLEA